MSLFFNVQSPPPTLTPFFFLQVAYLLNPDHLALRVFHPLGFSSCTLVMQFVFFCPVIFCRLAAASRAWIRLGLDPFGKAVGGGGVFHHEAHNV